jgi:LuxR family maltose regulon positive regulatory protein
VAWLSLDPDDDDPARFFAGMAAALRRAGLAGLPAPEGSTPDQLSRWNTRLINMLLADAGSPYMLVLDDLHLIGDPAIFAALDQLIERLPPRLRVIALTRYDPPLALARLRVRR